jgi:hypothetical protein
MLHLERVLVSFLTRGCFGAINCIFDSTACPLFTILMFYCYFLLLNVLMVFMSLFSWREILCNNTSSKTFN